MLNSIFDALPNLIDSDVGSWICVIDNPGITQTEYDRTIATKKNWIVIE